MKKLGFVEGCVGDQIDPTHFFFANTPQFLRLHGMHDIDPCYCRCRINSELIQDDLVIRTRRSLVASKYSPDLLFPARYLEIELNKNLYDAIRTGDPDLLTNRHWYFFGKNIRIWMVRTENISTQDLIPPSVLYDMKHTEEIIETFNSNYTNSIWEERELAVNYDGAIIGMYLSELMSSDESFVHRLHQVKLLK